MKTLIHLFMASSFLFAEENNQYTAAFAAKAPVIDGTAESTWDLASWDSIPYTYLGDTPPLASDFAGRYKVLWDANFLYILAEIVDDQLSDDHADPLDNYWNDDCLEIFLDENHNGGDHQNNFTAFAYHISTTYDVVDYGDDGAPHLFNDHIEVIRTQKGTTYTWEIKVKVFGENYSMTGTNTPLTMSEGKILGFNLAYCDNDGGTTRENFMGSANTQGLIQNLGYQDASVFGTLVLSQNPTSIFKTHKKKSNASLEQTTDAAGRIAIRHQPYSHLAIFPR